MKTLVIGRRDGNIADTWVKQFGMSPRKAHSLYHPDQDKMDLRVAIMIKEYIQQYGPFHNLLYAAAVNRLTWIKDMGPRQIDETYDVNVRGLILAVAYHMEIFGHPPHRIVAVVSDSSRTPMRGSLLYSSSKAALVGVLKNMARELAPDTVVVGVSPGIVSSTPMTDYIDETVPVFRGWEPSETRAYEKTMIPMKRRVTRGEVAETIEFAMSGPPMLSGSIIEITGGK